jgi:ribosomal protein S18 acetylase RimI-like enzyme
MQFRNATTDDLEYIVQIESVCFPPNEAASRESFRKRLQVFPQHFWLLEDQGGQLIGYINSLITNKKTIADEMFADAALHNEQGAWQTVFGLAVSPEFRNHGSLLHTN